MGRVGGGECNVRMEGGRVASVFRGLTGVHLWPVFCRADL